MSYVTKYLREGNGLTTGKANLKWKRHHLECEQRYCMFISDSPGMFYVSIEFFQSRRIVEILPHLTHMKDEHL